uniref:Uncharacterized protein n=1 Tax=Rhizophora mucronata TaxID=61149 RepID=A0A2P2JBN1_RHIMU
MSSVASLRPCSRSHLRFINLCCCSHSNCFFLRVRCQMRQHMFSSLELRSRVLRVATTLSHVLCRSVSSTPVTTSSTKYFVGLKCPPSLGFTGGTGFCSSMAPAPVSNIASKYPFIHSFPAITPPPKITPFFLVSLCSIPEKQENYTTILFDG